MRVLEGSWEEISRQIDLRGKNVQVVLNDQPTAPVIIRETSSTTPSPTHWFQELQRWADSHEPIGHLIDDSRDSIYGDIIS